MIVIVIIINSIIKYIIIYKLSYKKLDHFNVGFATCMHDMRNFKIFHATQLKIKDHVYKI
jgi:hypothetical protein